MYRALRKGPLLAAVIFIAPLWAQANCVPGDINQSDGVDAIDVQLVINAALNLSISYDGDINHDGQINAVDVQLVINAALGMDISGQIGDLGTLARVYVDGANSSGVEDGSEQYPFSTLGEGAAAVLKEGEIIVRQGVYSESIALKPGVRLIAPDGAFHTRLSGAGGSSEVVLSLAGGCVVQGLAVGETSGAAISVCASSSAEITNCVVYSSDVGIRVGPLATLTLRNAAVHGNSVGLRGGAGAVLAPVENCIFTNNDTAVDASLSTWEGAYNAFSGNVTDIAGFAHSASDLLADPRYVNIDAMNHHLQIDSPCRNAGNPAPAFNDLDGSSNDIGADGGPHGVQDLLAPHATITANPLSGAAPLLVALDGSASSDEWGIALYSWDFDVRDGIQSDAAGSSVEHTYTQSNSYTITLTVTDNSSRSAQSSIAIKVGNNLPVVSASSAPIAGPTPLSVQFNGTGTDPDGGPVTFAWNFGDGSGSALQSPLHTYSTANPPGAYHITLTGTDEQNTSSDAQLPLTITESAVLAAEIINPSSGGTVTVLNQPLSPLDSAWVALPSNAVSESLVATICDVTEALPSPRGTMSTPLRSIELGPTGVTFSRPVRVSTPLDAGIDPTRGYTAAWYDRPSGTWSNQGISDIELVLTPSPALQFDTTHFTVFTVGMTWALKPLGALGGTDSYAFGINNTDAVVGYSYIFVAANHRYAYRWDAAHGMTDLGTLGGKHSYAFDINDAGQITGYLQPGDSFGGSTAFVWDSGSGLHSLGTLGGIYSMGFDINASGQVAGQVYYTASRRHAFLWDPVSGVRDLGTLGGENSFALGINDSGQVVGGAQTASGDYHAFVWSLAAGLQDLGTFGGGYSQAEAINASGQVAGGAHDAASKLHAFLWDATHGLQDLGTADGDTSHALGLNDAAQVVGYIHYPAGLTHAFLWERENGVGHMYDLNDLIDSGAGTVLTAAQSINNAGNIVGRDAQRAFLLRK